MGEVGLYRSVAKVLDGGNGNAITSGKCGASQPGGVLQNLTGRGGVYALIGALPDCVGMGTVARARHPLQIVGTVVRSASVDVVGFIRRIGRRTVEGATDNAVHGEFGLLPAVLGEGHDFVSPQAQVRFEDEADARAGAGHDAANLAEVRHFIPSLVGDDGAPFLTGQCGGQDRTITQATGERVGATLLGYALAIQCQLAVIRGSTPRALLLDIFVGHRYLLSAGVMRAAATTARPLNCTSIGVV